jgi:hypothetical protein
MDQKQILKNLSEQNQILGRLLVLKQERDDLLKKLSDRSKELFKTEIEEDFNKTYITASELCLRIGVDRSVLFTGGKKGGINGPKLPCSFSILHGNMTLWNRAFILPYAEEWKKKLSVRRTPKHLRISE